jgi:hypothetical protein
MENFSSLSDMEVCDDSLMLDWIPISHMRGKGLRTLCFQLDS